MGMNDYQRKILRKFVSDNFKLIKDKKYTQIYNLLQLTDNETLDSSYDIINCFTEMMFKIGENPFEGVKEIYYGAGMGLSIEEIIIPDSVIIIGDNAFENCKLLKSVKFSKNLESIGYRAFGYCNKLQYLDIPDSVTYIKEDAFIGCSNLKSIKLGTNIEELETGIFYDCENLKDLYYGGTIDDWMQLDNCWPDSLDMPETCILHCTDGDYIWDDKKQGWVKK